MKTDLHSILHSFWSPEQSGVVINVGSNEVWDMRGRDGGNISELKMCQVVFAV